MSLFSNLSFSPVEMAFNAAEQYARELAGLTEGPCPTPPRPVSPLSDTSDAAGQQDKDTAGLPDSGVPCPSPPHHVSPSSDSDNAAGQQCKEAAGVAQDLGPCPTPPRPLSISSASDNAAGQQDEEAAGVLDSNDHCLPALRPVSPSLDFDDEAGQSCEFDPFSTSLPPLSPFPEFDDALCQDYKDAADLLENRIAHLTPPRPASPSVAVDDAAGESNNLDTSTAPPRPVSPLTDPEHAAGQSPDLNTSPIPPRPTTDNLSSKDATDVHDEQSAAVTEQPNACPTPPRPLSNSPDRYDGYDDASSVSDDTDDGTIDIADYLKQDPSHVESFLKANPAWLAEYLKRNVDGEDQSIPNMVAGCLNKNEELVYSHLDDHYEHLEVYLRSSKYLDKFLVDHTDLLTHHLERRQQFISDFLFRHRPLLHKVWDSWPDELARHLKDKQGFLECLLHDYPKILQSMFHKTTDHAAMFLNLVQHHPDTGMAVHTEYDRFIIHMNMHVPYNQRHEIDWMPTPEVSSDKARHAKQLQAYKAAEDARRLAASNAPPRPLRNGGKCNTGSVGYQTPINRVPAAPVARPDANVGPRLKKDPKARPMLSTTSDGYEDSTKYGTGAQRPAPVQRPVDQVPASPIARPAPKVGPLSRKDPNARPTLGTSTKQRSDAPRPSESTTRPSAIKRPPPSTAASSSTVGRSSTAPPSPVSKVAIIPYPAPAHLIEASRTEKLINNQWRLFEQDAAIKHMLAIRDEGRVKGEARFDEVGRRLQAQGIDRNGGAVKNFWNRFGRARSGFDERKNKKAPLSTSHQGNRWGKRKASSIEDFAEAESSDDEPFRGTPAPKRAPMSKKRRVEPKEVELEEGEVVEESLNEAVARRAALGLRH